MENKVQTSWQHFNPVRIVVGQLADLAMHIPESAHILLVTSQGFVKRGIVDQIRTYLLKCQVDIISDIKPNPDLLDLDRIIMEWRSKQINMVLGLGGGSSLDAAKVLAMMLPSSIPNPLQANFREGLLSPIEKKLPLIAIPTTAGTGAEVTPFATIWDHERKRKHSLADPLIFPELALFDARLTLSLPEQETLNSGLDTISHSLESLWNRNCTPVTRAFSFQALSLAAEALPGALEQPNNLQHRSNMQAASLLAGMAISQTRTAIAHAMSYPITVHFGVPHGLACSFSLALLLEMNLKTLALNRSEQIILERMLDMLQRFNLPAQMRKFSNLEQLLSLAGEMYTPGRSDNYCGEPITINELLSKSMTLPGSVTGQDHTKLNK
jgi:phosphonate metabolism-associated iron-containing alcohol dehydrogenase